MNRSPRALGNVIVFRAVALAAAGLIVVSAALLLALSQNLRHTADQDLDAAVALVTQADSTGQTSVQEARLLRLLPARALVAIQTEDGSIEALSASALEVDQIPIDRHDGEVFAFRSSGQPFRGTIVQPEDLSLVGLDGTVTQIKKILIAVDISDDRETVRTVSLVAFAVTTAVLTAVGIATALAVKRALSPMHVIAATASRIAASGEAEPLPRDTPYVETEAIARSVEDALHRRLTAESVVRNFVADASHELRTPIAKIQGWTDLLIDGSLDAATAARAVDSISAASEELTEVVDELGLLARLDTTPSRTLGLCDVTQIAHEVISDARSVAPGSTFAITTVPDALVTGDATGLRTAMRNLVGNAVVHGGGNVRLDVAVSEDQEQVIVTVSDDGPGIPQELRSRVFDRFFTTAAGSSRHAGLGLAIVAAIARSHGGSVCVLDAPVSGTTMELCLPRSTGRSKS